MSYTPDPGAAIRPMLNQKVARQAFWVGLHRA